MSEKWLKKVAANVMPSAATWRSGWDSNPRGSYPKLISSKKINFAFDRN